MDDRIDRSYRAEFYSKVKLIMHHYHPDHVKKGGACVYYKETLAVHFLQRKLDQYIVVNFKNKKKGHVISLYRSPSI